MRRERQSVWAGTDYRNINHGRTQARIRRSHFDRVRYHILEKSLDEDPLT